MSKEISKKLSKKSKKLSYLLRHDTEGLYIDKYGYISTEKILEKLNISLIDLDEIIKKNDKKRFSYSKNKEMLRAVQGHSFPVDLGLKKVIPPFILYHGTKKDNVNSILKKGLHSMSRNHVHLSKDVNTANIVAKRRKGENVILEIKARAMYSDGVDIFISENGVYLTEFVESKYIKIP